MSLQITSIPFRPPFYKGAVPLSLQAYGRRQTGLGIFLPYYFEFERWRNFFIYSDTNLTFRGIATGSASYDYSSRLLAEALLIEAATETLTIEEIHYAKDGTVRFRCVSLFDLDYGFKIRESASVGQKEEEYYVWPVH